MKCNTRRKVFLSVNQNKWQRFTAHERAASFCSIEQVTTSITSTGIETRTKFSYVY